MKISSGAIVCIERTVLEGDITIGHRTVIHPTAVIQAKEGPIVIGDFNLIEENAKIINNSPTQMTIGCNNVFEVGSYCESNEIGDNNILESKCKLGNMTKLSNGCVIGAMCEVNYDEILPENTIIFGSNCNRRIQHEKPATQTYQLDFLSKILPNYQKIDKPNYKPVQSPQ